MAPGVTLRRTVPEDREYIQTLLSSNELPVADLDEALDSLYVGEIEGRRIGVGGLEQYQNVGLLRSVVIEEAVRGVGHGTEVCKQLLNHAQTADITEIFLLTTTAEEFFAQLGFDPIARESVPESIRETREFSDLCPSTAVCMKRELDRLEPQGQPSG